jgi:ferric-dicitrate binding protein FerR (iron transport regulator)
MDRRLLAAGLLAAALGADAAAAKGPVFKVAAVDGGSLTADGKAVSVGAELAERAVLALDKGTAVIEFGDQGRMLLTGPAEFEFGEGRVLLSRGRLLSVLDRLKGRFSVQTPVAVAAVRGTEFFVEAREDGRTYLCLCSGVLEVTGAPGLRHRKTIRSDHHLSYIYSRHGKRLDRNPWKMEKHTDKDIGMMRAPAP